MSEDAEDIAKTLIPDILKSGTPEASRRLNEQLRAWLLDEPPACLSSGGLERKPLPRTTVVLLGG